MFITSSKMLVASLLACLFSTILSAHQVDQIYAEQNETGIITVQFDVAYAIPETRDDPSAPQPKREWLTQQSPEKHTQLRQEAERYLRKYLHIHSKGKPIDYTLGFPDFEESPHSFISLLNQGAYYRIQLLPEELSITSIEPKLNLAKSPKLLLARKIDGKTTYTTFHPPSLDKVDEQITPPTNNSNILLIGFKHVIPNGLDHILFILGICLTASSIRQLLFKSLIFTIAHALSMALIISKTLPIYNYSISNYIEPVIALSIAFIATETFFRNKHNYGYFLIAIFGLVHGCGFAGSLGSSLQSLNTNEWVAPLIVANIGIELAQALLVICTFSLLFYLKKALSEKNYTIFNLSSAIAISIIGITWFLQRL